MNWHTIHQDRWLIVVDKPYGLPTQAPKGGGANLYDQLRKVHPYVGLHHRLDTPASGLLLLTLSKQANANIAQGFREGWIHRSYLAVVLGDPGATGAWSTPVDGKTARTRFTRLSSRDGMSVIRCTLETGRTHQVRRHAAEAGHPLLGDRRHGGAAGRAWPRLALHAALLELDHPVTEEPLRITAPVPADLSELVEQAGGGGQAGKL